MERALDMMPTLYAKHLYTYTNSCGIPKGQIFGEPNTEASGWETYCQGQRPLEFNRTGAAAAAFPAWSWQRRGLGKRNRSSVFRKNLQLPMQPCSQLFVD